MQSNGGTALATPTTALSGFDSHLGDELERWLTAEPGYAPDGFTLAWLVTARIRAVGRQHLSERLLDALAEIRRTHGGQDDFLLTFLDAVLARHDGGFDTASYLALPLLGLIAADTRSGLDATRLSTLLLTDVLRHEQQAWDDAGPDEQTRSLRLVQAGRFIAETEPALGTALPAAPGTIAGEWFSLTALPVSIAHDEYTLVRTLQAYELTFDGMTRTVSEALAAARIGQPETAAMLIRRVDQDFRRLTALHQLLASLRAAEVEWFASYLAGADLGRPEAYRRFEKAVGTLVRAVGTLAHAGAGQPDLVDATQALYASHQNWLADQDGLGPLLPGPVEPAPAVFVAPVVEAPQVAVPAPVLVAAPVAPVAPVAAAPVTIAAPVAVPAAVPVAAAPVAPVAPVAVTVAAAPVAVPAPAAVPVPAPQAAYPARPTHTYVRQCANNRQFASDTLRMAFGR